MKAETRAAFREARVRAGLSQAEAADVLDLPGQGQVSELERIAVHLPAPRIFRAYVERLGLDPLEVLQAEGYL